MNTTRPPKQNAPRLATLPVDAVIDHSGGVMAAPERCVWGTDWPHPQMNPAPEAGLLFDQFVEWVPDAAVRQRILVDNAARLYGF
jgi:hypothetical protein